MVEKYCCTKCGYVFELPVFSCPRCEGIEPAPPTAPDLDGPCSVGGLAVDLGMPVETESAPPPAFNAELERQLAEAREQIATLDAAGTELGIAYGRIERRLAEATGLIERLRAKGEDLKAERNAAKKMMDGVRDIARDRNPKGATILDFMAVWNEQQEKQIKSLREHVAELERERDGLRGVILALNALESPRRQ